MKILSLLFFVFTFPSLIFIATCLYGGFSTTVLKVELAKSGMYEKVISAANEPSEEEADPLFSIIQKHINPDYLQTKVEGVIDDTALWVTGKTETPPILSFRDIKDEITAANPTLLADLQKMSQEMQAAAAAESGETIAASTQPNEFETFIKNDFSFPLKDSFAGLKQAYTGLTIALPVLAVLLVLSLVGLWFGNPTLQKRFRWIGITFLISGVFGIISLLLNQGILTASLGFLLQQENQLLQMVYPLFEQILTLFVSQYASYQTLANYVLFAAGIICLVLSFIIKSSATTTAVKPVKPAVKKSR